MLKRLVFQAARAAGGFAAVRASRWRRDRLLILCYHGISMADEHEWNPGLYMPPGLFRQRLAALRAGRYNVLRLDEGVRRLAEGVLPPRSVAVTFDDGAYDFATQALPLLREFDVPATLYQTTFYSEYQRPVYDTMGAYLLWRGRGRTVDAQPLGLPARTLDLSTDATRRAAMAALREENARRRASAEEKDAQLARLAALVGVDYDDLCARRLLHLMTPAEVAALPAALVDVQLHTHRHRTPVDEQLFRREIADNRQRLEAWCGPTPPRRHFCYPSGVYDGHFLAWLHSEGVVTATTCLAQLASRADHPLLLPRFVDTTGQSALAFEAWLSGFAALLPRRQANRLDPARLQGAESCAVPPLDGRLGARS